MKISRMIMSLGVVALLGLALTGCNDVPVDMGPIPDPKIGEPGGKGYGNGDGELDFDALNAKNRNNTGGDPDAWRSGAEGNLGARGNGEFTPVVIPGLHFEPIYFDYDRSDLKQSELNKLQKVADFIRTRPELGVIIEGHCDDRGSEEYNRALGERRAISLRDQLVRMGVPDAHMKTMSYGKDRPAIQGTSSEARAKNRRGETIPARMQ